MSQFFTKEVSMLFSVTVMLLQLMSVLFHLLVALFFVRRMGMGGTKLRYVLKTCEIGITALAALGSAVILSLLMYLVWDMSLLLKFTTYYVFMFGGYLWWLRALIYSDEDDWFHDSWRRVRHWLAGIKLVLSPKLASIYSSGE